VQLNGKNNPQEAPDCLEKLLSVNPVIRKSQVEEQLKHLSKPDERRLPAPEVRRAMSEDLLQRMKSRK